MKVLKPSRDLEDLPMLPATLLEFASGLLSTRARAHMAICALEVALAVIALKTGKPAVPTVADPTTSKPLEITRPSVSSLSQATTAYLDGLRDCARKLLNVAEEVLGSPACPNLLHAARQLVACVEAEQCFLEGAHAHAADARARGGSLNRRRRDRTRDHQRTSAATTTTIHHPGSGGAQHRCS